MKCIILVAGYATRLYPLTKNQPKALLDIGNIPLLTRIIRKVEETDISEVIIVSNDLFYHSFLEWKLNVETRLSIEIMNDNSTSNENRVGRLGDLFLAIKRFSIDDDILLIFGDNLVNFSLKDFLSCYNKNKKFWIAAKKLSSKEEAKKYGVLSIDKSKKIIDFAEKPENPSSTLISTGLYILPKSQIKDLEKFYKKTINEKDLGPAHYIISSYKEKPFYAFVLEGKNSWFDIGSLEEYALVSKLFS